MKIKIRLTNIDDCEQLAILASGIKEDIWLEQNGYRVDAKSAMSIFSLNLLRDIWIISDDTDEILSNNLFIQRIHNKATKEGEDENS